MKIKDFQRLIEYRIDFINKKLGTNYTTDYCTQYGGYNLYYVEGDSSAHRRGPLGFDARLSAKEMLAYVDGIYNLLSVYSINK